MHSKNHRDNSTDNAGFPPAPSEAHRLAVAKQQWLAKRLALGREARCLLALARVQETIEQAAGHFCTDQAKAVIDDKYDVAYRTAYMVGEGDCEHGITGAPPFIRATGLETPWVHGYEDYESRMKPIVQDENLEPAVRTLEAIFAKARAC